MPQSQKQANYWSWHLYYPKSFHHPLNRPAHTRSRNLEDPRPRVRPRVRTQVAGLLLRPVVRHQLEVHPRPGATGALVNVVTAFPRSQIAHNLVEHVFLVRPAARLKQTKKGGPRGDLVEILFRLALLSGQRRSIVHHSVLSSF